MHLSSLYILPTIITTSLTVILHFPCHPYQKHQPWFLIILHPISPIFSQFHKQVNFYPVYTPVITNIDTAPPNVTITLAVSFLKQNQDPKGKLPQKIVMVPKRKFRACLACRNILSSI